MKKMLLLLCIYVSTVQAQQTIVWRRDKVTQLIFSSNVEKFRPGYTSDDAITQKEGRALYLQPVGRLPETNLNVITEEGRYYAFNVVYSDTVSQVNYIIPPEAAFYREVREEQASQEPMDVGTAIATPSVAKASAKPVKVVDPAGNMKQIEREEGYLTTQNTARLQRLSLTLKGVYADRRYLYFKLLIENGSNVPFDVDYLAFSIGARQTRKASTQERVQIVPLWVSREVHCIEADSLIEVICCFEKFTIGRDKILLAEMLERNGDRNVSLSIEERFITQAHRL